MATPFGIRIFEPMRAWMAVNAIVLGLLVAAAASILTISSRENERLVRLQMDVLVSSRSYDIERGDYRSFIEGAGKDFSDLFVEIRADEQNFSTGSLSDHHHCAENVVPTVGRGGAQSVAVKICRPSHSPLLSLIGIVLAYGLVSVVVLWLLRRLERSSTEALIGFFADQGVVIEDRSGLIGLLGKVKAILADLRQAQIREIELARSAAYAETALQVAHDIRSPLAALRVALNDLNKGPEASVDLARKSIGRIDSIAEGLLIRGRMEQGKRQIKLERKILSETVKAAVEEARIRFRGVNGLDIQLVVSAPAKNLEAVFENDSLIRVLINLINNGVEACSAATVTEFPGDVETKARDPLIRVSLDQSGEWLKCVVEDHGPGIPDEVLPKLMERGATFGKANGSGLGLFHARQTVLSWSGRLEIQTKIGQGTQVIILLPIARVDALGGDVVLVDDDVWVREAWERAAGIAGRKIRTFATAAELYEVLGEFAKNAAIYLDLELAQRESEKENRSLRESGEDVAVFLRSKGYFNIYLATGHDVTAIAQPELFKDIVGKDPPFESK